MFRLIADIRLQLADTVGAVEMLARVAVDPALSSASLDSAVAMGARFVAADSWELITHEARWEMQRLVLARTVNRRLSKDVELLDSTGQKRRLQELAAGRITLVVFWSRAPARDSCRPAYPLPIPFR